MILRSSGRTLSALGGGNWLPFGAAPISGRDTRYTYLSAEDYENPSGDHQRRGHVDGELAPHPVHQSSSRHGHGEVTDVDARDHQRHLARRQRHGRTSSRHVLHDG